VITEIFDVVPLTLYLQDLKLNSKDLCQNEIKMVKNELQGF